MCRLHERQSFLFLFQTSEKYLLLHSHWKLTSICFILCIEEMCVILVVLHIAEEATQRNARWGPSFDGEEGGHCSETQVIQISQGWNRLSRMEMTGKREMYKQPVLFPRCRKIFLRKLETTLFFQLLFLLMVRSFFYTELHYFLDTQ